MKLITIALATALTSTSTLAFAQMAGVTGYGSVTQPSVGSYAAPVGTTNVIPTWRNTGPAAPMPSARGFGNSSSSSGIGTSAFGVSR
jgi:hypothetical protein